MIAVMGAAGNVGSKVTGMLLREGERVRVLEHLRDLTDLRASGAEVVRGDATNPDQVAGLLVDMQLAVNEGRCFTDISRTADSTTWTSLEQYLDEPLSDEALQNTEVRA